MSGLALFWASALTLGFIYVVLSLALNLEAGVGGLWDLGIVSFFAAGAYTYAIFTMPASNDYSSYILGLELPIMFGLLAAGFMGAFLAYIVGFTSLRLKNEYFLITTFAFAEVFRQIIINETWLTNGVAGLYSLKQPFKFLFSSSIYSYVLLIIVIIIALCTYIIIEKITKSPFGRSLKALRENEPLAITAAINPFKIRLHAFLMTGFFAGIAGAMYVWYNTVAMPPMFTSNITFFAWTAIVIGGIGNNRGAILGGIILMLSWELLRFFDLSSDLAIRVGSMRVAIIGLILIIILRFRAEGILPETKSKLLTSKYL